MNTQLKAVFAAIAVSTSMAAMAADPVDHTHSTATPVSSSTTGAQDPLVEARNEKTQAKAEYKARKKVAEANKTLDVADCKTASLDSKDLADCKQSARVDAKDSKREAKHVYKAEKADIKSETKADMKAQMN